MFKPFSFRKILFAPILIVAIYLINKYQFSRGGVGNSVLNFMKFEGFLILLIAYTFLAFLKNKITSYILILISILSFYLFFNEYFIIFDRPLKFSDYNEIPELISVSSITQIVFVTVILLLYVFAVIYHIDIKKVKQHYYLLIPLVLFLISVQIVPNFYLTIHKKMNFEIDNLNLKKSARENGYLNFMIYEEALKNKVLGDLKHVKVRHEKDDRIEYMKTQDLKPNIHLIVLESFFDPHMFTNLSYNKNPIHSSFEKYYTNKNLSISPAFAGGTPFAEYEILTGTPAYRKYSSVEFNLFTGHSVKEAFPNKLKSLGYTTVATNALSAESFNSYNAYKGLGFDEQYFLTSNNTYLKKDDNDRELFDGDLFHQNLEFIKQKLKTNPQTPILNYVLGMYGHTPHTMNTSKRPKVIESFNTVTKTTDPLFTRAVNQTYYRTKHLTKYIEEIFKFDSDALVLVIGDHLPKINEFNEKGYLNDNKHLIHYYLIYKRESILIPETINHYNVPDVIFKTITRLNKINNEDLSSQYDQIMKQAIKS